MVNVTFCAGLLLPTVPVKLKAVGLKTTLVPTPIADTESVLLALLATTREASRVPVEVGVNVTLMMQLAPAAIELQLLDWPKSPALVPVKLMAVTVSAPTPVLVRVTGVGTEVVPTPCTPNCRKLGTRLATGVETVPLNEILDTKALPAVPPKLGIPAMFLQVDWKAPLVTGNPLQALPVT